MILMYWPSRWIRLPEFMHLGVDKKWFEVFKPAKSESKLVHANYILTMLVMVVYLSSVLKSEKPYHKLG